MQNFENDKKYPRPWKHQPRPSPSSQHMCTRRRQRRKHGPEPHRRRLWGGSRTTAQCFQSSAAVTEAATL
eukprot:2358813-Pyramimonas_sp.AAC.1